MNRFGHNNQQQNFGYALPLRRRRRALIGIVVPLQTDGIDDRSQWQLMYPVPYRPGGVYTHRIGV